MSVIDFYKSIEYYLEKFDEKCDNGNYPDGFLSLSYAEKIADLDDFSDIYLAKAQAYAEIERIRSSNYFYFKTLRSGQNRQDALFGLFQNMLLIGNKAEAGYYSALLEQCADDIDMDAVFDIVSNEMPPQEVRYSLVYDKETENINLAAEAIKASRFDEAIELLKKTEYSNKHFVKAMNDLFVCYTIKNDYENALISTERALSKDPEDVVSLCNKILLLKIFKKIREADVLVEKLLSIKTDEPFEIAKIATTMCDMGRHEEAEKYLLLTVNCNPRIEMYQLLLGIAKYNLQKFYESKKIFIDLLKLDENDVVAKYYLKYVNNAEERFQKGGQIELLNYTPQMPYAEILRLYKKLENFIKNNNAEALATDEDLKDAVTFILETGDAETVARVLEVVANSDVLWKDEYIDEILLDSLVGDGLKMRLAEECIMANRNKISMTVRALHYVDHDVLYPENWHDMPTVFKRAYAEIVSLYYLLDEDKNPSELKESAEKVFATYKEKACDFRSSEALSVIIAKNCDSFADEDGLCEIMNVNKNTLKKYKSKLFGNDLK